MRNRRRTRLRVRDEIGEQALHGFGVAIELDDVVDDPAGILEW